VEISIESFLLCYASGLSGADCEDKVTFDSTNDPLVEGSAESKYGWIEYGPTMTPAEGGGTYHIHYYLEEAAFFQQYITINGERFETFGGPDSYFNGGTL